MNWRIVYTRATAAHLFSEFSIPRNHFCGMHFCGIIGQISMVDRHFWQKKKVKWNKWERKKTSSVFIIWLQLFDARLVCPCGPSANRSPRCLVAELCKRKRKAASNLFSFFSSFRHYSRFAFHFSLSRPSEQCVRQQCESFVNIHSNCVVITLDDPAPWHCVRNLCRCDLRRERMIAKQTRKTKNISFSINERANESASRSLLLIGHLCLMLVCDQPNRTMIKYHIIINESTRSRCRGR